MHLIRLGLFFLFATCALVTQAQTHFGFLMGGIESRTSLLFKADLEQTIVAQRKIVRPAIILPIEFQLNHWASIVSGLSYTEQGLSLVLDTNMEPTYQFTSNRIVYVQMPLLYKFKLALEKLAFYGNVGVYGGYLLQARKEVIENSAVIKQKIRIAEEGIPPYDYGLKVGFGMEKKLSKDLKMMLDARYQIGLKDINEASTDTAFTESFGITIGLLIPIVK